MNNWLQKHYGIQKVLSVLSVFGKLSENCFMLDEYKKTIIKEKLLGSSDWLKEFSQLLLGIED